MCSETLFVGTNYVVSSIMSDLQYYGDESFIGRIIPRANLPVFGRNVHIIWRNDPIPLFNMLRSPICVLTALVVEVYAFSLTPLFHYVEK